MKLHRTHFCFHVSSNARSGLLVPLMLVVATMARAQSSDNELLPQNRPTIILQDNERNPFGQRTVQQTVVEQVETEESRLRAFLQNLPISGVSDKEGSFKILLGSISVEKGGSLPSLISGQNEKIYVREVTAENIELGFVEKDGSSETRLINLPVNVKAEVRYLMETQTSGKKGKAVQGPGLQGVVKNAPPQPK